MHIYIYNLSITLDNLNWSNTLEVKLSSFLIRITFFSLECFLSRALLTVLGPFFTISPFVMRGC